MPLSRRDFLKLGAITAVTASVSACGVAGRYVSRQELPQTLAVPGGVDVSVAGETAVLRRLLNRAGYGPHPGDLAQAAQKGVAGWLEEQLHPAELEDLAADLFVRHLTFYQMDASELAAQEEHDIAHELIAATVLRPLYSKRQLYETMVEFWSDHFNIYLQKDRFMPALKLIDDREVIRPHALGKFRDLLFASAHSPAMLLYLDNTFNERAHPNENYARELMELHTLGVHGGYTQQDVMEVARIFTGWKVGHSRREGQFLFNPDLHDFEAKVVLGHTFPAGRGQEEGLELLELLVTHPATAHFIANKLVRRFVADDPPATLVEQVAQTYQATDGDIKSMLRLIFLSQEFASAPPKLKRPFSFFVSALRALHTDLKPGQGRAIARWLAVLGQMPFHWPPPNGYPDVSTAWTNNLLARWNFALALLHDQVPGATVPLEVLLAAGAAADSVTDVEVMAGLVFGRSATPDEQQLFTNYLGNTTPENGQTNLYLRDVVALMLASPGFQWT